MNFIRNNRSLIKLGLVAKYSTPLMKYEHPQLYLTPEQIDGIVKYVECYDCETDIESFIVQTILRNNGFDENGKPIKSE